MVHRALFDTPDIASVLANRAAIQPDVAAILAPGRAPLTFAGLYGQLRYVAGLFAEWGIRRGDPVALLLPKGPEMAVATAILPACATVMPLAPNLAQAEYEQLFRRCHARALVAMQGAPPAAGVAAERTGLARIDLRPVEGSPAGTFTLEPIGVPTRRKAASGPEPEAAYILITSGTTAERKLVPSRHAQIVRYASAMKDWLRLSPADRNPHLVPMHFASGIKATLMVPLLSGSGVVCMPEYRAESFFPMLEEFRPTWFSAGFTIFRDILAHVEDYRDVAAAAGLRFMRASAGRLEPEEIARLERAFRAPLITGLGSTESGRTACNPLPPQVRKPDSVGLPFVNEVRIGDESGRMLAPGEEGEILVRGPLVFDGYLDDSVANEQAFHGDWFRSGDLGKLDQDGYLYITGRLKEIINRGGEKISPVEIDTALASHPAVADAAAFGIPHPTLGEIVAAAVVAVPGAAVSERELRSRLRALLPPARVPVKIWFVESLPRTKNGKLQRLRLREELAGQFAARPPEP